jgi:hypothetical protein
MVGASGTRDGIADDAVDSAPEPIRFAARTFTWYELPLTSEEIANEVFAVLLERHVTPLSVEYSKAMTLAPPLFPGETVTASAPS